MKDKQQIYNDYGISDDSYLEQAIQNIETLDQPEDRMGKSLVGNIYDDLTGKNAQMREFAQQEYLQEKQWEYDHPANQMARMKEAGINPLTAGQGISGGNTSASAPSVSSPTPLGNPIDTAANLGRTISDIDIAQAKKPFELANIDAKTNEALETAGLNRWQKLSFQAVFPYLGAEKFAQIMNMMADYDNKSAEYHNIVKQHDLIKHQIGKLKGEIELNKENLSIAELQHKILEQEEAIKKNDRWFSDESKRFYKDNGYYINVPSFDSALPTLYGNKKSLSAVAEWLADYYESNAKATSKGQQLGINEADIENGYDAAYARLNGEQKALVDNAFDLALHRSQGELDAKLSQQQYQHWIDTNKEWVKGYVSVLSHISNNPVELADQVSKVVSWAILNEGSKNFGISSGQGLPVKPKVVKPK